MKMFQNFDLESFPENQFKTVILEINNINDLQRSSGRKKFHKKHECV